MTTAVRPSAGRRSASGAVPALPQGAVRTYPGTVDGAREDRLARAFVALADTLVDDYDVVELMHGLVEHSVAVLGASAAGLLLADPADRLTVMAASSERARLIEVIQIQAHEGPCLDAYVSGAPIVVEDLAEEAARWPRFAVAAQAEGYRSVAALPLRLRTDTIGALNLFRQEPGVFRTGDLAVGQALADVATIGILQERAVRRSEVLAQQLQAALDSRVVIEQAKGVLAERLQIGVDEAFAHLRAYARSANQRLAWVARALVEGRLDEGTVATR